MPLSLYLGLTQCGSLESRLGDTPGRQLHLEKVCFSLLEWQPLCAVPGLKRQNFSFFFPMLLRIYAFKFSNVGLER